MAFERNETLKLTVSPYKFKEVASDPVNAEIPTNTLALYAKDKGGVSTLYWKDDAGVVHDFSVLPPTGADVTAGSTKITLGGTPTGAALKNFSIDVNEAAINHNALLNLATGDVHTQYALLAGRAGGQQLALGTKTTPAGALDISTTDSTPGVILTPSNTVTDGSKFTNPPLRLQATYDSDPTAGVTPTTKDLDLVHVVSGAGPNSYLAVRMSGRDSLRVFDGTGTKVTVSSSGQTGLAFAVGPTGEETSSWGFTIRDIESVGSKDLAFEDGTGNESFHIRGATRFVDFLRGARIRNNESATADSLTVTQVGVQSGYLFKVENSGGSPFLRMSAGNPRIEMYTQDASTVALSVSAFGGQTADLQQWKNASSNVAASIQSDGKLDLVAGGRARNNTAAGANTFTISKIASQTGYLLIVENDSGSPFLRMSDASPKIEIYTQNAAHVALQVRGFTAQSADLEQWQDASGNVLAKIFASGNLGLGTPGAPGAGTDAIVFADGTALATMAANTAGLYANTINGKVRMVAIDETNANAELEYADSYAMNFMTAGF